MFLKFETTYSFLSHPSKITSILFLVIMMSMGTPSISQENKILSVPKISNSSKANIHELAALIESLGTTNKIDILNWPEYSYQPEVTFQIAHTDDSILLVYHVTEKHVLAKKTRTNSRTHQDSCVEFFVSFEDDPNYYNFEFNGIGTVHLAYGPDSKNREFISSHLIQKHIDILPSLGKQPMDIKKEKVSWTLSISMDKNIFIHHPNLKFLNLKARGNFYKCGDLTIEPHFLSWNKVPTESPSFHQPKYFGTLVFE